MSALEYLTKECGLRTIQRPRSGGNPISSSSWYEMLRNPLYMGQFISLDEWYEVKHPKFEPMVTEEEYWQLQAILGGSGRPRPKLDLGTPFIGILRCGECHSGITRDLKKQVKCLCKYKYSARHREACPKCETHISQITPDKIREYEFYRCTKPRGKKCSQKYVRREELENQVHELLNTIVIPQEFVDWALEDIDEKDVEELRTEEEMLKSLQSAYESKQDEINRHHRMYVKGYIADEEEDDYQKEKRNLLRERNQLKARLDALQSRSDEWRERTEEVYTFARNAKEWFETGDYRTKTQILSDLGANAQIKDKRLVLDIQAPFLVIGEALEEIKAKYPGFEPEKMPELLGDTTKQELVSGIKSTWLATPVSNQKSDTNGEF